MPLPLSLNTSFCIMVKKVKGRENRDREQRPSMSRMDAAEAMERLSDIMNDTPVRVHTSIGDFDITALKPGTQWLIASEAVRIQKSEKGNFSDMIRHFAESLPAVARVIALAVLNDRDRIFKDYEAREYSGEYRALYDSLMWESDHSEWAGILVRIMEMLSFDFFFDITSVIATLRDMTLERKMTMEERRLSSAAQSGGR